MLKNILFATDGSENSKKAQEYVKNMANTFNSCVIVVNSHKIPGLFSTGGEETHSKLLKLEEKIKEQSNNLLSSVREDYEKSGIKVRTLSLKARNNNIGDSICYAAKKEKADMIVMGTRGLGSVKGLLIGSVSNYVIHNSEVPVFIVPYKS